MNINLQDIDWVSFATIGSFIIGFFALFNGSKKLNMIIKPKMKSGNIDMSKSEYTIEKHVNKDKKSK